MKIGEFQEETDGATHQPVVVVATVVEDDVDDFLQVRKLAATVVAATMDERRSFVQSSAGSSSNSRPDIDQGLEHVRATGCLELRAFLLFVIPRALQLEAALVDQ